MCLRFTYIYGAINYIENRGAAAITNGELYNLKALHLFREQDHSLEGFNTSQSKGISTPNTGFEQISYTVKDL
jgi:hypothetical protein